MTKELIEKSVDINASREIVWKVLLDDKLNRLWFAEFSEGTHAETDWRVGSKAIFTDNSQSGIAGKVVVNKPNEMLSIEYEGIVMNNVPDYESEGAQQVKGGRETYVLSGNHGATHLSIACDMAPEYFQMMSSAWDKALQKIKVLSEGNQQN